MPIYEYSCTKCGTFEINQSISEDPLKRCPRCRSKVTKLISASAFHLKGGGWYADAYQKKGSGSASSSATDSAPKSESSSSTTSSAPATTAASTAAGD